MRWIWIDKFIEFTPQKSATALKNTSMSEEHLHDLYPDFPIVPHSLLVEGMAQTAGLMVGEAKGFKEKVALAKIGKAVFHRLVIPGDTVVFKAVLDQLGDAGASCSGRIEVVSPIGPNQCAENELVAEIELMFSHIDQNMSGLKFPEHNFVFTTTFTELLTDFQKSKQVAL